MEETVGAAVIGDRLEGLQWKMFQVDVELVADWIEI